MRCIVYSPKPLQPGDRVVQQLDWEHRFNHMQQHTGQHLLSAIMFREFDLKTVGWGMGSGDAMNYVDISRKPTEEEIQKIQKLCNDEIRNNSPIVVSTPNDAKHERLPGDYDKSEGVVRVIRIGDIDNNTCVYPIGQMTGSLTPSLAAAALISHRHRTSPLYFSAQPNLYTAKTAVSSLQLVTEPFDLPRDLWTQSAPLRSSHLPAVHPARFRQEPRPCPTQSPSSNARRKNCCSR